MRSHLLVDDAYIVLTSTIVAILDHHHLHMSCRSRSAQGSQSAVVQTVATFRVVAQWFCAWAWSTDAIPSPQPRLSEPVKRARARRNCNCNCDMSVGATRSGEAASWCTPVDNLFHADTSL